jgi:hypothetical protein
MGVGPVGRASRRRILASALALLAPGLLLGGSGCGGGSSGPLTPYDFAGEWDVQVIDDETDCGGGIVVNDPFLATVVQTGTDVVITTPLGVFTGTVSGSEAVVTGSFPDGAGFSTFTAWVLRAGASGFDGDITWTWSLDESGIPVECEGVSLAAGVRRPPPPPPVTIDVAGLPTVETGTPVDHRMALAGGCGGPFAAGVIAGSLPPGVTVGISTVPSPAGLVPALTIEGHPLAPGTYAFTILVTDTSCGATGAAGPFFWDVLVGPVTIFGCAPPFVPVAGYPHALEYPDVDALADTVFNSFQVYDFLVIGGAPPYSLEVVEDAADPDDGPLPDGLSIPDGFCTVVGSAQEVTADGRPFRMTFRATDSLGETGTRKLQLMVVTPPPVFATVSLSNGTVGVPYADTLQVVDGIPPFTFSVTAGSLPDGLTLDADDGSLTGTPTTAGPSTFTVTVASNLVAGNSASREFTITVN